MKEKIISPTEKARVQPGLTPVTKELVTESAATGSEALQKKARRAEILEELREKLGIADKKKEDLLQKEQTVYTPAIDHVEVRTEQWVKDIGLHKQELKEDMAGRTNHTSGKEKKKSRTAVKRTVLK